MESDGIHEVLGIKSYVWNPMEPDGIHEVLSIKS